MFLQQCPSLFTFPSSSPSFSAQISVKSTVFCCLSPSPVTVVNGNTERRSSERNEIRLGLPSKGRMATDTLDLLKVVSFPLALFGCRKVMENLGFWIGVGLFGLGVGRFCGAFISWKCYKMWHWEFSQGIISHIFLLNCGEILGKWKKAWGFE